MEMFNLVKSTHWIKSHVQTFVCIVLELLLFRPERIYFMRELFSGPRSGASTCSREPATIESLKNKFLEEQ
jgi:hypothetical protein